MRCFSAMVGWMRIVLATFGPLVSSKMPATGNRRVGASHSDSPRGLASSSGFSEGPILLSPRSDLPSKTAIYENVYEKFKTAYFQND